MEPAYQMSGQVSQVWETETMWKTITLSVAVISYLCFPNMSVMDRGSP